ncbi:YkgJ family cysteine cluster protein [Magnetospirillum sp. SS-4]|uniref:YkgJ family cysteine cluster protein n=1 Tax=Magnetospirillum sp. SS-4 TaxID=2681465 RepID=UPI0013836A58|nr:YkgJ family cysteine cluster protein [Magnetospirillum sp. SS-4]CAA7616195.1 conserved hypothetical protein [Magnetospirillum sp. SS-4]
MSSAPGYGEARRRADQAAGAALAREGGQAAAARAAVAATDSFFDLIRHTLNLDGHLARMACKAGCAWCCYQQVAVTSAELALIVEAVAGLPPERRAEVRASAAEAAVRGRGLDPGRYWAAHIRCPLLDETDRCLVHAARPMACRAFNSADATVCHNSFLGETGRIPVLAAQHGTWAHAQAGLADALARAGIAPGPVALADGLTISPTAP